ncbi:MAG: LytTR family DNA-binding domain-containing protein [Saprospiraceae bacterium]|nr:LytTR family DNA-binding domain-containing protein [Saprospiraceae bacterium]
MIHCIIVDDEQHAIDILSHYVQQTPQLHLAGCFTHPLEALQAVQEQAIDLIFLDILMPELSGIEFIKSIRGKCKVILTTAYGEYALEGYELHVVDYLLKPIRLPRFLTAVQKAVEVLGPHRERIAEPAEHDFIFVKTEQKGKLLKIELSDIAFIEGMKNYVAIHAGGKKTLVNTSMKRMEEQLPTLQFMRVHKSFIVPVARITGIESGCIRLKGLSTPIAIGENYREAVMELVKGKVIGA